MSEQDKVAIVTEIFFQRQDAVAALKRSAEQLDAYLKDGTLKIGDQFTVKDLTGASIRVVIVDQFSDEGKNFLWRPLLVEHVAIKKLK